MKKTIPKYNPHNGEVERVFNGLSVRNKKIINNHILRWNCTAGKTKVQQKRKNLIKIADVLECDLDKITKEKHLLFVGLINNSNLEDSTKNDLRKHYKEFIREQYSEWEIKFGKLKEVRQQKENIPKKYQNPPSIEDIAKLPHATPNLMLKAWLNEDIETGGRGSELLNSKWKDFNEKTGEIILVSTKNKTTRPLPLNKTIPHLQRWKKEFIYEFPTNDDYIYPSPKDRIKHVTLGYINSQLRSLGMRVLGIPITTYMIRHVVLSYLQTKLPAKVYEKIADHSIKTASRYSHLNDKMISNAMNEFVYKVEELPQKKKHELELQIEEQGKTIKDMQRDIKLLYKINQKKKLTKEDIKDIVDMGNEFEKNVGSGKTWEYKVLKKN